MEGEDRLGRGALEHARFDHRLGALHVLFGGLKDELDRSGQLIANRREGLGDPESDGGMDVVAADVADSRRLGGEGHGIRRVGVDRVHVRPEGDHGSRLAATKEPDDAVPSHAGLDFEAERPQSVRHDAGRPFFMTRDFRVPVDVATQVDEVTPYALQAAVDTVDERLILRLCPSSAKGDDEQNEKSDLRFIGSAAHRLVFLPITSASRTGKGPDDRSGQEKAAVVMPLSISGRLVDNTARPPGRFRGDARNGKPHRMGWHQVDSAPAIENCSEWKRREFIKLLISLPLGYALGCAVESEAPVHESLGKLVRDRERAALGRLPGRANALHPGSGMITAAQRRAAGTRAPN